MTYAYIQTDRQTKAAGPTLQIILAIRQDNAVTVGSILGRVRIQLLDTQHLEIRFLVARKAFWAVVVQLVDRIGRQLGLDHFRALARKCGGFIQVFTNGR